MSYEYHQPGQHSTCSPERCGHPRVAADRPTTEPRRAIDFERCPVCDNMAVVRLPGDWQEQDRSMPIIACGNPWHYATRSLGDGAEAAQGAAPRAEGLDVPTLRDALRRVYKSRYHERFAEPLADEYARLARPSNERETLEQKRIRNAPEHSEEGWSR